MMMLVKVNRFLVPSGYKTNDKFIIRLFAVTVVLTVKSAVSDFSAMYSNAKFQTKTWNQYFNF